MSLQKINHLANVPMFFSTHFLYPFPFPSQLIFMVCVVVVFLWSFVVVIEVLQTRVTVPIHYIIYGVLTHITQVYVQKKKGFEILGLVLKRDEYHRKIK